MKEESITLGKSGGVVTRFLVDVGDEVYEGQDVLEYHRVGADGPTKTRILRSNCEGSVVKIVVSRDATVDGASPVLLLECCAHDIQFKGLCAECGKDLTVGHFAVEEGQKSGISSLGHGVDRTLLVSRAEAEKLGDQTASRLRTEKKLSCILDLDQTLIHATIDARASKVVGKDADVHEFILDARVSIPHYVKFRPGVVRFLKTLNSLCELHIYTMGTKPYAQKIASLLEEKAGGKLFGERIFSREDGADPTKKDFESLFPCDDSMVIIVDDREDVWKYRGNVLKVDPYSFFRGMQELNALPTDKPKAADPANKKDKSDDSAKKEEEDEISQLTIRDRNEHHLTYLGEVISKVHSEYYSVSGESLKLQDCKKLLTFLRLRILAGVHICFSGVIPLGQNPRSSHWWRVAEASGAVCHESLNPKVTHLVARAAGTDKVNQALEMYVAVVHLDWLEFSTSNWFREPEKGFLLCPSKHRERPAEQAVAEDADEDDSAPKIPSYLSAPLNLEQLKAEADDFLGSSDSDDDDEPGNPAETLQLGGEGGRGTKRPRSPSDNEGSGNEGDQGDDSFDELERELEGLSDED
eukprot:GFYU01008261.1.p1 GENE.GFYU01008261.1~~GFYU01008261.1.p1  ORF type:complete len:582 (-),score=51.29 GFYU01008261.1:32-1777(-)